MSTREVIGDINPPDIRQSGEVACFPASLAVMEPVLSLTESTIVDLLRQADIYDDLAGVKIEPARAYRPDLERLGLSIGDLYPATVSASGKADLADAVIKTDSILSALDAGNKVLIAFPKRRQDEEPFLHFAAVTGYETGDSGIELTLVDTSDIDGGIEHLTVEKFRPYVTPTDTIAVMAWTVHNTSAPTENLSGSTSSERPRWQQTSNVGRSLLAHPLWQGKDTGLSVPPETEHAVSCVIPTTAATKTFGQYGDAALARNNQYPEGYPRFVTPKHVRELSLTATGSSNNFPYPSHQAAEAAGYLARTYGGRGNQSNSVEIRQQGDIHWLISNHSNDFNQLAWQNTGLGVSSRQALAELEGRGDNDIFRRGTAEAEIEQRITNYTDVNPDDIYLFPTGMAAIYSLNQVLISAYQSAPAAQLGFPYVDSYEQRRYGPHQDSRQNILDIRSGDYTVLQQVVGAQALRGIMTEFPSNPLLWTPDYPRIHDIVGDKVPVIIDDTVGTIYNLDDDKLPASVVARTGSLTKFFSGVGDVMMGSIVLRAQSPHYDRVKAALEATYEDTIWYEDAEVMARNSREFGSIMPTINDNAIQLAHFLIENFSGADQALQTVHHPSLGDTTAFDAVKKTGGGYSGLMTLRFNQPDQAYRFFDAVRITGGPSLGTLYSLKSLYTWLAHKDELERNPNLVTRFGVVPDLTRFSIGVEPIADLQDRFSEAMERSSH